MIKTVLKMCLSGSFRKRRNTVEKRRNTVAILGLVMLLQLTLWLSWMPAAQALTDEQQLYNEAWRIVSRAYVDESFNEQNWWLVRQKMLRKSFPNREATYQAIQDSLARLDDPFTRLLRPEQYRNLQVTTSGELTGVGLQISKNAETNILQVIAPIDGSPAESAGVFPKDLILEINGVSTVEMNLDDAAARMRGAAGSPVTLTIQRDDSESPLDIVVTRQHISLNPVVAELRQESGVPPVGYLRLSQFNANAVEEFGRELRSLERQGAKGYILDLRNNPGGLLQAGVAISRMWIDDGPIVYTVDRRGILDNFWADGSAVTEAPLVVLVNGGTASASEILAGALQDSERGELVGQQTFGKGLIQSLFELSDGSGLAVTVAKYETPDHHDINKLGIEPDVTVELDSLRRDQLATSDDGQYQTALQRLSTLMAAEPKSSEPVAWGNLSGGNLSGGNPSAGVPAMANAS